MNYVKNAILVLFVSLSTIGAFGQTKKVVRQTKQAPVTQKRTSIKSKTRQRDKVTSTNREDVGFLVDGLRYLFSSSGVMLCEKSNVSGNVSIPKQITYKGRKYSVTGIGVRAFYDCRDLTSVSIPETVIVIDEYAFAGCSKLTSVTIPNGVRSIRYGAFMGCDGLKSVLLPNSVNNMDAMAFPSATKVTIQSSQESKISTTGKKTMTEEDQLESLLSRANEYAANNGNKENRNKALRYYLEYLMRGNDKKKMEEVSKTIYEMVSGNKSFEVSTQYLKGSSNGNYSIMDMLLHPLLHFPTITNGQSFKEMLNSVEQWCRWKLSVDSKYNEIVVYNHSNKDNMPHVNGIECVAMNVQFLKKNEGRNYYYRFKFNTQEEADKFFYEVCMDLTNYKMTVKRAYNYRFLDFDMTIPIYSLNKKLNQETNVFLNEKEVYIKVNQYFYKM